MSNYCRSQQGNLYFFTLVTEQRQPWLTQAASRAALREAIGQARACYPFEIHAWVLLPDHLHCVWQLPGDDADFGRRWSLIKRKTSQALDVPQGTTLSRQLRGERGLWQRRFWEHQIRDHEDYRRHLDYLHWNPVKHGLVERVRDWPWSSFHRLVGEGIYPADWGGGKIDEGRGYGE